MKLTKPAYAVNINIGSCQIEVWCNDVIIFEYKNQSIEQRNLSITVPINHVLLKQTDFTIKAKIYPRYRKEGFDKESFARIQLFLMDYLDPEKTKIKLFDIKTPEKSDITKENSPLISTSIAKSIESLPYFELNGGFKDEILPFEEIGWENSKDLNLLSEEKLLSELFSFYTKLKTIIESNDIKSFQELNKDKDDLLANVYYLNSDEVLKNRKETEGILKRKNIVVIPFEVEKLELVKMAGGRLVKLRRKNGLPLIIINEPSINATIKLDLKLHKPTENIGFKII